MPGLRWARGLGDESGWGLSSRAGLTAQEQRQIRMEIITNRVY